MRASFDRSYSVYPNQPPNQRDLPAQGQSRLTTQPHATTSKNHSSAQHQNQHPHLSARQRRPSFNASSSSVRPFVWGKTFPKGWHQYKKFTASQSTAFLRKEFFRITTGNDIDVPDDVLSLSISQIKDEISTLGKLKEKLEGYLDARGAIYEGAQKIADKKSIARKWTLERVIPKLDEENEELVKEAANKCAVWDDKYKTFGQEEDSDSSEDSSSQGAEESKASGFEHVLEMMELLKRKLEEYKRIFEEYPPYEDAVQELENLVKSLHWKLKELDSDIKKDIAMLCHLGTPRKRLSLLANPEQSPRSNQVEAQTTWEMTEAQARQMVTSLYRDFGATEEDLKKLKDHINKILNPKDALRKAIDAMVLSAFFSQNFGKIIETNIDDENARSNFLALMKALPGEPPPLTPLPTSAELCRAARSNEGSMRWLEEKKQEAYETMNKKAVNIVCKLEKDDSRRKDRRLPNDEDARNPIRKDHRKFTESLLYHTLMTLNSEESGSALLALLLADPAEEASQEDFRTSE